MSIDGRYTIRALRELQALADRDYQPGDSPRDTARRVGAGGGAPGEHGPRTGQVGPYGSLPVHPYATHGRVHSWWYRGLWHVSLDRRIVCAIEPHPDGPPDGNRWGEIWGEEIRALWPSHMAETLWRERRETARAGERCYADDLDRAEHLLRAGTPLRWHWGQDGGPLDVPVGTDLRWDEAGERFAHRPQLPWPDLSRLGWHRRVSARGLLRRFGVRGDDWREWQDVWDRCENLSHTFGSVALLTREAIAPRQLPRGRATLAARGDVRALIQEAS